MAALAGVMSRISDAVKKRFAASRGDDEAADGSENEKPAIQDGNAPLPNQQQTPDQQKYGPNFEELKKQAPEIVAALQQCVIEYRLEAMWSQRRRVLRTRVARDFWNEIQYGQNWWGATDASNSPSIGPMVIAGEDDDEQTGERFEYVTNWFQGYGLSFIALMAQDVPNTNFAPRSRDSQEDITFAKAALDVVDLTERNNKPKDLLAKVAKYFWTDGICGTYTRYVVDGERFGFNEMPILEMGNAGGLPMPKQSGTEKIPRGQEVITLLGGLELVVPNWADDCDPGAKLSPEAPYLQWNCEPHTARLKAAFPHVADEIAADSGLTADMVYERITRLGVKQQIPYLLPGDAVELLATFSRTWLRKWAFKRLNNKDLVQKLEALYPDGCYVAFAGLTYCESRNENVDKHWRVKHAMQGDGQWHPAVGQSLISPSERYNDLANQQMETIQYGVPSIYASSTLLDFDALRQQTALPGQMIPVQAKPGQALGDQFYQPDPAKESVSITPLMTELAGPIMQFLSGLPPAIWGGEMNDVKTASGYAQARDQAMGRLGLIRGAIVDLYCDTQMVAVECFRENRPQDVEIPFAGETGDEKPKWIRLGDLQGNIMVEAEPDEGMPRLRSQQRAVLEQLFQMGAAMPPNVQKILSEPANVGWIMNVTGLNELDDPDEDARTLMMRRIQMLLDSQPVQPPGVAPVQGPGGQIVMQPPQPIASLPLNDVFDNPIAETLMAECLRWANGDAGQTAARENPAGYKNVYLYAKSLAAVIQQKQQQAFQQQMMLKHAPPKPPEGAKPPSMSVAIDKMPPEVQSQALAMDGISVDVPTMEAHQDQQRQDEADALTAKLAAKPSAAKTDKAGAGQ